MRSCGVAVPRNLARSVIVLVLAFVSVLSLIPIGATVAAGARGNATQTTVTRAIYMPHTKSPISHVIVVIQENHAFDNYFWDYPNAFGAVPGGVPQPTTYNNVKSYNPQYPLNWNYPNNQSFSAPAHAQNNILSEQDNGSMDGFYYTNNGTADGLYPNYIVANELGLAQQYAVADNYYTDFAGPTLPNRFYYYAITSGPILGDSGPANNTVWFPSLPQELQRYGISYNSFDGDYGYLGSSPSIYFSTTLSQLMPMLYFNWIQAEYNANGTIPQLQLYSQIYSDISAGTLPSVSWFTSDWSCCTEHPGSLLGIGGNVTQGQQSILKLVQTVENSAYWNSTAIFITYDEGGGFFDHSPSPIATPEGTGLRVPLVVVSPYTKEGYVSHAFYTPSSILHFIEWNWGIPSLGALDNQSNLPLDMFNFSAPPRSPLPQSVYGSSDITSQFPWSYTQPVSSSYLGNYQPELLANGDVNWTYQTQNILTSSPVVSAGSLYTCGSDGILRSFDAVTGALNWADSLGSSCRSSPTPLAQGGVVTTTIRGAVTAFSPGGSVLWNLSLGAPIYGNLTLAGSTLFGTLQNGTLFAIDPSAGTVLWEKAVSTTPIYSAPVYDPATGLLLLSATGNGVVALNTSGGAQWTASVPGGVYAPGAVCGSTYYVTSPGGGLYPISLTTGTVGTAATLNRSLATPLCLGSSLYVGDNTTFRSFSLPGLTQQWSYLTRSEAAGTPTVLGGNLLVDTEGGQIDYFPTSGPQPTTSLSSATSFFASATVSPAGQYFAGEDGNLYAKVTGGEIRLQVTPATASVNISSLPVILTQGKGTALEAPGAYTITASAPGYTPTSVPATVYAGKVTYANVTLSAQASNPSITSFSASPSTLTVGGATTFSVSVTGGTTPYTYLYSGLPAGCSSANTLSLACTPTATGTFTVTVNVTDAAGRSTAGTTTLTVNPASVTGPSISQFGATPNPIVLGNSTTFSLQATGGAPPYTYAYQGLPSGCSSKSAAQLLCTPTSSGKFTVLATVTDSKGLSANASLVFTVTAPAGYPSIVAFSATPSTLYLGNTTLLSVSAIGGTSPYTYAFTSLPTGCSTSNSAALTCTPTAPGVFLSYVKVTDANGHTASASTPVTVLASQGSLPTIASFAANPNPVSVNSKSVLTVQVTGGKAPFSYVYSGLPAGCAGANSSSLDCTPTKAGIFNITVLVTDARGHSTNATITLKVTSSGAGGGSTAKGLPEWSYLLIVVAVILVAAVVIALLLHRRKRRSADSSGGPSAEPPAQEAPAAGENAGQPWGES